MKERVIRISVLTIVFVLALIGFSRYTNRGNADMTADMGSATLPTISFTTYGYEVNSLVGHVNEMDMSAVRDTVTPLDQDGNVTVNVQGYGEKISRISYEVYEPNGENKLQDMKEIEIKDSVVLSLGDVLEKGEEGLLKIQLQSGKGRTLFYYARVSNDKMLSFAECLNFIKTLHTNILEKKNTEDVKAVMESNEKGDNTTLQHVTIHSDISHITWGDLKPQIIGKVKWNVAETKEAYTSIQICYRVKCIGDNGKEDIYNVKEFFRVRCSEGKNYLLTYDRRLEEVFNGSSAVLTSKGIHLGMASDNVSYKTNEEGTIVSFVQANELWSYNAKEEEFSLIFSFADAEKEDERNYYDEHSLKILAMEDNGDATFAVHGYMNRGIHEGESGVAIYYFDLSKNVVEEKAFIPSDQSHVVTEKELGKVAYYNDKDDVLYLLNGKRLHKIHMETGEDEVLLRDLESEQYVSSEDGNLLAYQKTDNTSEAVVLDFSKDTKQSVKVAEGEVIRPLGFVMGDFVYGVARPDESGEITGEGSVLGMYKLEIRDSKNQVVKDYQIEGNHILKVKIEDNMITLERAVCKNGIYADITEDYITNNEDDTKAISLESYWSDLKENQLRLVFEEGIEHKRTKVLKPKQLLFERDSMMEFKQNESKEKYAVYGYGEMAGAFEEAGDAIRAAKTISGVVISPEQRLVWEDGNRVAWYRNFEMKSFVKSADESSMVASAQAILKYEGIDVNVKDELPLKSVDAIFDEHCGEAVWIQGCSSADVRYLISKGTPVIAMTGMSDVIVLVGYDAKTITYINPENGGTASRSFSAIDEMISGTGNTFLAYVK